MDEFEKLLEEYLDEKIISEKITSDNYISEKVEEKSKTKKCGDNFVRTISICEFVSTYLGTPHLCKNLKHIGLKSFKNPYVVGIPNDFAIKNPDCIIRNEIIVVIDSYGNPGTYINPKLLKNIQSMEEAKIILKILNSIHTYDLKNIEFLYNEYMRLNIKISELEQQYISGCELLTQLKKKSILREIRKYAKETKLKKIEFNKTHRDILENIAFRARLIEEIEKIVRKEELLYQLSNDVNVLSKTKKEDE